MCLMDGITFNSHISLYNNRISSPREENGRLRDTIEHFPISMSIFDRSLSRPPKDYLPLGRSILNLFFQMDFSGM
jgi:hypothetical protein